MRATRRRNGLRVNAIAGTRVVFLGLDLAESGRAGLLGFSVRRHDAVSGESVWMLGRKTFAATDPGLGPGGAGVSTFDHPVQDFWWADYQARPGRSYTYEVVARYGSPTALTSGAAVKVRVTTEPEQGGVHEVYFNRGAVASQQYVHDFGANPSKLTGDLQVAAYRFLSRGLEEALLAFLARAVGAGWSLHGTFYEFAWPSVLDALRAAHERGVDVAVVYDAMGQRKKNAKAIDAAAIADLCTARTAGKLMHNKFVVLSHQGTPVAVWTGSTNVSENGIFGHLNVGHVVNDAAIAGVYEEVFARLATDPALDVQKVWVDTHSPPPAAGATWTGLGSALFSPRTGNAVLARYADEAGRAQRGLFMTFAFGMGDGFKKVYRRDDDVLRMALMEDYGTGRTKEREKGQIIGIQRRHNVVVSIGGRIPLNGFDTWVEESSGLTSNVQWVHTKFMLVDPLSAAPTVITGSANFSPASTSTNDENMLVIRGDTTVADIYFTEYMRLFAHYGFREAVGIAIARHEDFAPAHLKTRTEDWLPPYFDPADDRCARRLYFAGPLG